MMKLMYVYKPIWPRGLRRRSAAARLLGSWVRIPQGAWMSVSCTVLCVAWVAVFATNWSLIQRNPTGYVYDLETPKQWGGLGPSWAVAPQERKYTPAAGKGRFRSSTLCDRTYDEDYFNLHQSNYNTFKMHSFSTTCFGRIRPPS
jgi:hypothetical protein